MYWVVKLPDGQYGLIPKPYNEAILGNVMERAFDATTLKDPTAWDRLRRGLLDTFMPPTDAPVGKLPMGCKPEALGSRIVLAHGEVTGHAHAIHDLDNVDVMVSPDGGVYLRVKAPSTLRHEEHAAVILTRGNYRVVRQVEYSPQEIRNVAD